MAAHWTERVLPAPGPLRPLAAGTLISAVGNGAWYTSWAIFLTHSAGLSPGQVGLGMTLTGLLGTVASAPLGRVADRVGARVTLCALLIAQGAASFAYGAVDGMVAFLIVAAVAQVAGSGTGGPRSALVLGLAGPGEKLLVLGRLRSISHAGWAAGAILGGVAISLDSRAAYDALLALNGVSYLLYAWLIAAVRAAGAGGRPASRTARQRIVLRDRPYMSLAGLMGILALCWSMLSTGLPLWVTLHTHAPRAVSAAIVLISCVGIAALQVPANRAITSPLRAARAALAAGMLLAASCALFALTAGGGGPGTVALMLAAASLHIAAELMFVSASWGLSVPLMAPEAPGEYQGVFAAGEAAALTAAPVLMTTLIAGWGAAGWLVLGAIFLIPSVTALPATRWALRTRPWSAGPGPGPGPAVA